MEVYCLNDAANLSIPQDIREQFHRDENGRVLFFTAPPIDTRPSTNGGAPLGHSITYLAARARRQEALREKRKREADEAASDTEVIKKAKLERDADFNRTIGDLTKTAENLLEGQIASATEQEFRTMYPENWKRVMESHLSGLDRLQRETDEKNEVLEVHERKRKEDKSVPLAGKGILLDEAA